MTERDLPLTGLTAQDLAQLALDTPYIRELIDGELFMTGSPTAKHQRLVGNLYFYLRQIIPNGEAMLAPLDVIFADDTVLQPDLFWVAQDSTCVEIDGVFRGAPDLVVEVLSPTTAKRDVGVKFRKYEACGVREYWQVDPTLELITIWVLRDGAFRQLDVLSVGDRFTSPTLGVEVYFAGF